MKFYYKVFFGKLGKMKRAISFTKVQAYPL